MCPGDLTFDYLALKFHTRSGINGRIGKPNFVLPFFAIHGKNDGGDDGNLPHVSGRVKENQSRLGQEKS